MFLPSLCQLPWFRWEGPEASLKGPWPHTSFWTLGWEAFWLVGWPLSGGTICSHRTDRHLLLPVHPRQGCQICFAFGGETQSVILGRLTSKCSNNPILGATAACAAEDSSILRHSLSGPNVLESTRTLTARKPLNFGNSGSLTRKLGKSDSETRKTNFWICVFEFLRRSFWVARFCPKKSGTKTPKMRPTTVNAVFWTFLCQRQNCPKLSDSETLPRKLCLGNSETRTFWVSELEFLSFWVGGVFDFPGFA